MALAVDGYFTGFVFSASPISITMSTVNVNSVVLLVVQLGGDISTGSYRTVTGVSGGGLSWSQRASRQQVTIGGVYCTTEYWWAPAASIITSQVITITPSSTTYAGASIAVISGALDYLSPFDLSPDIPFPLNYAGVVPTVQTMGPFDTLETAGGQMNVSTALNNPLPAPGVYLSYRWASWGDAIIGTSTDVDGVILLALFGVDEFGNERNYLMTNGFTNLGFSTPEVPPLATVGVSYIGYKIFPSTIITSDPLLWVAIS